MGELNNAEIPLGNDVRKSPFTWCQHTIYTQLGTHDLLIGTTCT